PASSTRRLNGFHFNQTHLAASLREDGLEKAGFIGLDAIRQTLEGGDLPEPVEPFSGEELYTAKITAMALRSPVVGLGYISYVTPWRQYDYFPGLDELELRKQTPVLGGFRSEDYVAHREWAHAPDGTMVPLSVIHRADADLQTPHPVIQYGYGSYEASSNPGFSVSRLSLLDRGVVYVVAHVRGGGELGRDWYLQGKKLQKTNTFTDFVAVTDHVAAQPWADESRIAAYGGSAGGLLMGAIVNMAPEKYCGVLAAVPFVDPVTSISDPDLPLSALEWEEWGNPIEDKEVYEYMTSYAPYENVRPVAYPPIAAVTSLNDTRVLYVEPAKWVPKLREFTTGTAPILLRIEMDGGHGGGSGRYRQWEDTAWEYAFLLNCLGIDSYPPPGGIRWAGLLGAPWLSPDKVAWHYPDAEPISPVRRRFNPLLTWVFATASGNRHVSPRAPGPLASRGGSCGTENVGIRPKTATSPAEMHIIANSTAVALRRGLASTRTKTEGRPIDQLGHRAPLGFADSAFSAFDAELFEDQLTHAG
ncbi:MAG: prolyl oligopeptidase family serine peptidase, partial [Kocuria sp.]|nr:prolyl oligopeptidase family serine peptidase [Kocuria sp.]